MRKFHVKRFFSSLSSNISSSSPHNTSIVAALIVQRGPLEIARGKDSEFEEAYMQYRLGLEPELSKGVLEFPDINEKPVEIDQDLLQFSSTCESLIDNSCLQNKSRLPQRKLYLMLKNNNSWIFPSQLYSSEEALHLAAQKSVESIFSSNSKIHVMRPPLAAGDKNVFFFGAQYVRGNVSDGIEHAWLSKDEIQQLEPNLFTQVSRVLDS